ncbi:ELG1 (YOR144C) [Zygosaccharomyces parabailii]|nr:ELG1 (YOR144C) [Zygosaccharomyces parabailii]
MKRTISVAQLLDGNARKRIKDITPIVSEEIEHEPIESFEMSREISSSPLKELQPSPSQTQQPAIDRQSVQSFLMSRKLKKDDEPKAMTLKCEGDELTTESRVTYPINSKKTSLKNLFSNFKQPDTKLGRSSAQPIDLEKQPDLLERFHEISKSKELEAPLPSVQLINCHEDVQYKKLELPKKVSFPRQSILHFDQLEYASLNVKEKFPESSFISMPSAGVNGHSVWPQLMKPRNIARVMLEPALKDGVYEWIVDAFIKLKKTTCRSKLLKRQHTEMVNEFDGFIIENEVEENDGTAIEFVPLMILHGDAIGKNTLIEVIMQIIDGQIYEVNASSNRGKKDILDTLIEFSTTHYVKGQGSKGIILLDDVDIIFKEHDKFFWQAVEKLLAQTRRPVVITCTNLELVPSNLVQLAQYEGSLFHARRISHGTVTRYLELCCPKLGIQPDRRVLEELAKSNKKDIRKCLCELQFYSRPPGNFLIQKNECNKDLSDLSFEDAMFCADMLSSSDVISCNSCWKSSILQNNDPTLMSYESRALVSELNDEQDRLRCDYMIDNRIHLIESSRYPLLPFELNMGDLMEKQVLAGYKGPESNQSSQSTRFYRMEKAVVAFLSTRISRKEFSSTSNTRKTRNWRKIREILERIQGDHIVKTIDDVTEFSLAITSKKKIAEYINPYVLKLAQADANVKESNRRLFLRAIDGVPSDQQTEVLCELARNKAFKPFFFEANSKLVIDSWK